MYNHYQPTATVFSPYHLIIQMIILSSFGTGNTSIKLTL